MFVTVTAPFGTAEDAVQHTPRVQAVEMTPLRRDPILPFIAIGIATFVAIIVLAFLLTTPV